MDDERTDDGQPIILKAHMNTICSGKLKRETDSFTSDFLLLTQCYIYSHVHSDINLDNFFCQYYGNLTAVIYVCYAFINRKLRICIVIDHIHSTGTSFIMPNIQRNTTSTFCFLDHPLFYQHYVSSITRQICIKKF